ncbi:daptide biosynthesis RiPP recognition protein [Streptomyces sp. NPDC093982]|uniref:daptide biosynthesis RiPP recognition protein n=1 Tax=Streptomyces sp. NPDC093982 TaxID=3155077 RepID=UPI0034390732
MESILRRLNAWGRGSLGTLTRPSGRAPERIILTESADLLPTILNSDLCSRGTLLFSPSPHTSTTVHQTRVVPYHGSLIAPGDEMTLSKGIIVEVQEYAAASEFAIAGPTLARITSENDFRAFLYDADCARQYGAYPPALLHSMVQLCDLCALGSAHSCGGPLRRLLVTTTGEVKTTPFATTLGIIQDGLATLTANWATYQRFPGSGCPVCLSQAVPVTMLDAAHQNRPWLSRYLHALNALRTAAANGLTDLRVSGFGERLIPSLLSDEPAADLTLAAANAPLLLFNADMAFLYDPPSKRQFLLGSSAACLIEILLAHADHDAAADAAIHHLNITPQTARSALTQVTRLLAHSGIRLPTASGLHGTGLTPWLPERNRVAPENGPLGISEAAGPATRILPRIPRPKRG